MKTDMRRRLRLARKFRIKKRIQRDSEKLRLTVFRSTKHIYAQIVNDQERRTLVSASTQTAELKGKIKHGGNLDAAKQVGRLLGERAVKAGIQQVHCDRNGYIFAGRVKALADAVREQGIKF
ncbi:MAG: 50S ribosomal protein L18 [Nitrospinaceae bacterium]